MHRRLLQPQHTASIAVSFVAGLTAGIGFSQGYDSPPAIERVAGISQESEQVPATRVESVRGESAALTETPRRESKRSGAEEVGIPKPAKRLAPPPAGISTRDIAESSLAFTAFVRSGSYYGAGVLLDTAGHVVTCKHVLDEGADITVAFNDEGPLSAKALDTDAELDLALLEVEGLDRSPAPTAAISDVGMGDEVFGVGAPRKLRFSMSRGIVSYVGRPFDDIYYLQTDLPTNSGNSGGPVLNERGEVLAIASFIYRDSQGLAFALPIDYVYDRFEEHLDRGPDLQASFDQWKSALAVTGTSER